MTPVAAPRPERIAARDLLERTLDPGSYRSWDRQPLDVATAAGAGPQPAAAPGYAADLARARERAGTDEAVLTGEGRLHGHRVAVVASEFGFLAGSIGVAAAERLVHAVERATEERLPLLVSPSSGGTRMQEGTVAFLQMVAISQAVAAHKRAGLPYLVYLRHPTTGGVLASWGSLGQVTAAQPGALVGFLGPRVYEILHGEPFPEGVQLAENLAAKGLIDAVVPPEELRDLAGRVLDVLDRDGDRVPDGAGSGRAPGSRPGPGPEEGEENEQDEQALAPRGLPAWESVLISRRPDRPGVRRFLRHAAADVIPLHGTGEGEADPGLFLGLARIGSRPFVMLGQDRRGQEHEPMGPAALREARRGMRLAEELGLPLVTVIDTPGAVLSRDGEERAMAGEIARALTDLATHPAPTVAVLLGEGTGGGALAFVPADRVLAAEHAWLAPLPPEGASAIVHRDAGHAAQMAAQQGVRAVDLQAAGLVDLVVPERPDAAEEPEAFCRRLGRHLERALIELTSEDADRRRARRHRRYRHLGGLRPRPAAAPDADVGGPAGAPRPRV